MRLRAASVVATVVAVTAGTWVAPASSTASTVVGTSYARATPSRCPSVDGPKCHVQLRTGIRMAYEEVGPQHGRAVILLHGLTDSSRSWSRAMQALHARKPGWHVLAVDQRGQGDSSMPQGTRCRNNPVICFRPVDLANDVVAFMDAKHIRRAAVAGHSMGSLVAQEVALRHPRRVSKAILIASSNTGLDNPTLAGFVLPQIEKWRQQLAAKGISWPAGAYDKTPLDADPAGALAYMRDGWDVDPVAPQSFVDAVAAETARVKLGTWLGETEGLLRVDNTKRLRHLEVPTLVLWGTQDAIFYAKDQQGLIAALTRAAKGRGSFWWKAYGTRPLPSSGYQVDEIGHNVQWEAPDGVARDIASFVRTGRPTRDLFRTNAPGNVKQIVTVPGAARLIHRR